MCWVIWKLFLLVRILESEITLVHPYSRNKPDTDDCLFFIITFNSWYLGKWLWNKDVFTFKYSSQYLAFSATKRACKTKAENQVCEVKTYSWTKVTPLSRIRAIVFQTTYFGYFLAYFFHFFRKLKKPWKMELSLKNTAKAILHM